MSTAVPINDLCPLLLPLPIWKADLSSLGPVGRQRPGSPPAWPRRWPWGSEDRARRPGFRSWLCLHTASSPAAGPVRSHLGRLLTGWGQGYPNCHTPSEQSSSLCTWRCSNFRWDARWKGTGSKTAFFPRTESLISAHDILSWIKQEEQPYPWGPRDSMEGELGLDSGPGEWCTQRGPWVFCPQGWLLTQPSPLQGDVLSWRPFEGLYQSTVPFPSGGWQVC